MDKFKVASIIVAGLVVVGWGFTFIQGIWGINYFENYFDGEEPAADGEKIAAINITGTIDNFQLSERVARVARNDSYDAAILWVNSPGGGVYSSFQLEEAVSTLSEKKPTAAIVNQIGASGAYLAISPADRIYVHEQSLLGSLSVIAVWVSQKERYEQEGIDHYVFKTGKFKDMYQPWRGPTEEENRLINQQIENIQREMIDITIANRDLREEEIPELAVSGSSIQGRQAVKYGLADNVILTTQEAIDDFVQSAGIEDYKIVGVKQ